MKPLTLRWVCSLFRFFLGSIGNLLQVMGHMDVIGIISHGFNIYFPMAILLFCFATYFSLGSRFLSMLGFHQFVGDEEMTTDLVEEGRELVTRGMCNHSAM